MRGCLLFILVYQNALDLIANKTKLLWTGLKHSISELQGHGPVIPLGTEITSRYAMMFS